MAIKRKIIISIALVGAATGLIVYAIILPTIQDIKKISDAVYAERMDLEKKYIRGQLLKKTLEDFEKARPQKEKLASVFVNQGKELEFITALEKIAADQGLKQNIQMPAATGKKSEKNLYSRLLGITVNGDFIGILKYLKDLEKLNYYFNISSLTVGLDGKNPGNKAVNAILTGKIYTLPGAQKTF
ncbi:MAG: hypothetical protein A3J65_04780 [Candidatus Buchananbacteria bacterium RIFCSPHIGHO2_02_FULL_45_11b]|uniref:Type 4a pilus biogenesis protein PilO n=4 Tax=Candidatus Buchananiibacteriota TaxID=1817903 RepID=A0A1G1YKA1_9BACT|nr:MAG: hypothetical protein A2663_02675 [Candidatus Buchananbacteria bacterium RIFCSPHIGHO2_01_FULL_46_12]OGY52669.1 MAG: hypothetical protein A3J65_04780 [Candidatus Buchananbacteria bacterium RIFCSPHIGHO2_02_FULL_45_11b]OGY52775.1 MAG: hypothetical protein A3B15_03585 [Candidatus Buchananbacteria bacterium RIFCSPLOWO2_01_FULL_45_31]OGY58257.1 MAG: hypothetical protein A3H67_04015 [Candidatus Buchananbacteria bacterium RIFCSPLOWO2_02_FULL_46_11b]